MLLWKGSAYFQSIFSTLQCDPLFFSELLSSGVYIMQLHPSESANTFSVVNLAFRLQGKGQQVTCCVRGQSNLHAINRRAPLGLSICGNAKSIAAFVTSRTALAALFTRKQQLTGTAIKVFLPIMHLIPAPHPHPPCPGREMTAA